MWLVETYALLGALCVIALLIVVAPALAGLARAAFEIARHNLGLAWHLLRGEHDNE